MTEQEIREKFKEYSDYIKHIQIGQYNIAGVNIGFKSAKDVILDFFLSIRTQEREELEKKMCKILEKHSNWKPLKIHDENEHHYCKGLQDEAKLLEQDIKALLKEQ